MKKIIIIGASSGLGAKIAADFARAGWKVGIAARRTQPMLELCEQFPDNIVCRQLDVTAPSALADFQSLIELNGGMDRFLFCSGVGFYDPELNDGELANTLNVNVSGFARLTAAAYRYFRNNAYVTKAQIAAITSVAATKGIGASAAYSASKKFQQTFLQALDQLTHSQHVNLSVTDIRPGFIRTNLLNPQRNYPMLMNVDHAARLIEKAILSRRRVAYIDWRWGLLTNLWKLIPDRLWTHLDISF